jgi:lysophospholipase L1-like esterase
MLVLYGDSMLSGALESDTSAYSELSRLHDEVQCCALPGYTSAEALEWARQVPQFHSEASIIWVGHNDFRDRCRKASDNIRELASLLTGPWWVLAVPVLEGQDDRLTMFDRLNAELRLWAGPRFLEPIKGVCGSSVLPASQRLDRIHANADGNRLIARWLIANTIGATAQAA